MAKKETKVVAETADGMKFTIRVKLASDYGRSWKAYFKPFYLRLYGESGVTHQDWEENGALVDFATWDEAWAHAQVAAAGW